jgi:hypothetical protein
MMSGPGGGRVPKVKSPLYSLSASGSIAAILTFKPVGGNSIVTKKILRKHYETDAQRKNRQRMRDAVASFNSLSSSDRELWDALGSKYKISGWFQFFKEYQDQNTQAPNAPEIPEYTL